MADGATASALRFRDDELADEPAVSLDAFLDQPEAVSVRIEGGDDVRRLAPALDRLKLVEVDFPRFRDGRGYSSARILREMGANSRSFASAFCSRLISFCWSWEIAWLSCDSC